MPGRKKVLKIDQESETTPLINFKSAEEYVKSLEVYTQLLQREVDNLRRQTGIQERSASQPDFTKSSTGLKQADFMQYRTEKEIVSRLHNIISEKNGIIESNVFFFFENNRLKPLVDSETSIDLADDIKHLVEEGIIDWAVEKIQPSVIPNLYEEDYSQPNFFLIAPFFIRGKAAGIYIAKTDRETSSFEPLELEDIKNTVDAASIALDNIKSSLEINEMNLRMDELNRQMLETSKLASIGELAASIATEIENPLQVARANLKLVETGVGNARRRIQIIFSQIDKIEEIIDRFTKFAGETADKAQSLINLCMLIDEVLLFSGAQFSRDGIEIIKNYEDKSLKINGFKPQLEHVLLNILLFSRDFMAEGGEIIIGVSKHTTGKALITISDTGIGLSGDDISRLFEPYNSNIKESGKRTSDLYLVKNIIQQHKGTISVISEVGKGTTVRITFPTAKGRKRK